MSLALILHFPSERQILTICFSNTSDTVKSLLVLYADLLSYSYYFRCSLSPFTVSYVL